MRRIFEPILAGATFRDRMLACAGGLTGIALTSFIASWILNDSAILMLAGRNALEADPGNDFLAERFTGAAKLLEKDLGLALEVGQAAGLELPAADLTSRSAGAILALPKG